MTTSTTGQPDSANPPRAPFEQVLLELEEVSQTAKNLRTKSLIGLTVTGVASLVIPFVVFAVADGSELSRIIGLLIVSEASCVLLVGLCWRLWLGHAGRIGHCEDMRVLFRLVGPEKLAKASIPQLAEAIMRLRRDKTISVLNTPPRTHRGGGTEGNVKKK